MSERIITQEDIDELQEDEIEPIFCPHCLERGYQVRMGNKILMPGEKRDSDYDQFLQCPTCLWLCPIFAVEPEATIKDTVETNDSPFENTFKLETIPKRYTPAGKRASTKRSRKKIKLDDDKEINDLLRIYGDRVRVLK